MLGQIGYKAAADTSPWADIELTGATNALAAPEIMDWFTAHNFFDCGAVEYIYQKDGGYHERLLYDYSAASDTYTAVYDSVNQKLYVRKVCLLYTSDENENQKIRDYFIGNNYYSYQYGSLCK